MVAKTYIEQSLKRIDRLYRGATAPHEALLFAKLATLELCGWIEVSMDDIVLRLATRTLKDPVRLREFEKEVVKKIHGFDYDDHFKRLLRGVIGIRGVQRLEARVDRSVFDPMCGALSALKSVRDRQAHTYLKGTTTTLDAPSVTMGRFAVVYDGLKDVEKVAKTLSF